MLISILLIVLANLFLIGGILWSIFLRRLGKTRVRFFTILGALTVSIVVTIILRNVIFTEELLPWIDIKLSHEVMQLLESSPSLMEVAMGAVGGLLTPLLFFVIFLLADLISWVVYLVIAMIRGNKMKEKEADVRYAKPRTIILAVVQTLLLLVVWLIPLTAYSKIAPIVMTEISSSGMLDEKGTETVDTALKDYVEPINNNPMIGVFRVMGGDALTDAMMSFKVAGESVEMEDEVDSIASLATNILSLTKRQFTTYGSNEEKSIQSIAGAVKRSRVLSVIAGEIAHAATDAWKNGGEFIGLKKNAIYIDKSGMFDEFTDSLIIVLNRDSASGNEEALCADLDTIADMFGIMIRSDVFAGLGDQDALVKALSAQGVINSLITELGKNSSMKVLIPEMTNIGVRAIAATLELSDDKEEIYNDMMTSIAAGLNAAKKKNGEAQLNAVTDTLLQAFDEAGLAIDDEILACYAAAMVEEIMLPSGETAVTAQDVRAFFTIYSWSVENTSAVLDRTEASADSRQELLSGTVYAGMSNEALADTAAAALARLTMKLSELSATEDPDRQAQIRDEAALIVQEYYDDLSPATKKAISTAIADAVIDADTVSISAALRQPSVMAKYCSVVTLDELLVDVDAVAKKINASTLPKEAKAIEAIFRSAQTLAEKSADDEMDLDTISEAIGSILNALNDTVSFGRTKTDKLFMAVLQSESVRKEASLDMKTATRLAIDGSNGENLDYQKTFKAIFKAVEVMESMSKNNGELTDKEIEDLIRELNPQSASMIESFVTPDRMEEEYDVPGRYSDTAAPLISNIFGYMGDAEMTDEQYQAESTAINNIMTVTMTARDNVLDPDHSQSLFGESGVLGKDAKSTVDELMASESLAHSLNTTEFENDPFELSNVMANNQDTDEAQELEDAIREYYEENPTEETRQTLDNLAKLFGVSDIDTILGEQSES